MSRPSSSRVLSQLLAVIVAVVVIGVLYLAKTVILPLALALLFTFILAPGVTGLERLHLPRMLAVVLVILTAGGILGTIGWTLFTQLVDATDGLPAYRTNIHNKFESLHSSKTSSLGRAKEELDDLSEEMATLGLNAPATIAPDNAVESARKRPRARISETSVDHPLPVREVGGSQGRLDTISGALGVAVSLVLVVVFTFFMLLHREDLRNRLIRLTGHGHLNLMTQAMDDTSRRVSRYLSLQLLVNTGFGLVIFIALHLIALPHALLWGALAGLLRFVPYIGAPIGALLPTVLSIAVFQGWTQTLVVMGIFFCLEVLTANVLEPHVYGKHTGLSSLAILVAAIFWALIWGPIGLILSVPLTVCLVVVGAHVPMLQFLTVLLGDQPVMLPQAHYYQRLLANDQREASQVLDLHLKESSLLQLYDEVLIPALNLAEQDRHQNTLDDATVSFITQTTRDLVEELSLRPEILEPASTEETQDSVIEEAARRQRSSRVILCLPVRDDADEIAGIMLGHLLERAGYNAISLPAGGADSLLAAVAHAAPHAVCLSALPPYAIAHARAMYRRLRSLHAHLPIVVGLWNYGEDAEKAAREISGGEQTRLCLTLAQALEQVSALDPAPVVVVRDEASPGQLAAAVS
jgi:predicted PurR-regulated permease PerM